MVVIKGAGARCCCCDGEWWCKCCECCECCCIAFTATDAATVMAFTATATDDDAVMMVDAENDR